MSSRTSTPPASVPAPGPSRAPWLAHFGFTKTPFSKSLAPSQLFPGPSHQEAVARILHCVQGSALCVITGEVGAGKTVAACARSRPRPTSAPGHLSRPTPTFGTRGLYVTVVQALGARPRFFRAEVMAQGQQLSFDGHRVLTNPWFSEKPGCLRGEPSGIEVEDLPDLQVVLVSHAHYDHCDMEAFAASGHRQVPVIKQLSLVGRRQVRHDRSRVDLSTP